MKNLLKFILLMLLFSGLMACQEHREDVPKIGIILPIEHIALQEIVTGFTDKLHAIYPKSVQIKVMNAEGDINMQRAIIQQMRDQNYAMIVPIATGVTQMTAAMVHEQPIIGLAADFPEQKRQELHPCNIGIVDDEIPPQKIMEFIHTAYPKITHLTLIHSTSDKIFPDVKAAIFAGKLNHIVIKPLMVATLPELVNAAAAIPNETQGIFILKDNLMASGIATLINLANSKHIPLITSDEGTVQMGAGFSVGVHERQIGEEGALLANEVLNGKNLADIPIIKMKKLIVFINKKALKEEHFDFAPLFTSANQLHYQIELTDRK